MNIFSRINKLSEFGSKFIKMSRERNSVSGLLHLVESMAEGRSLQGKIRASLDHRECKTLERGDLPGDQYP